jgi:CheY-like chemotaxis protein
MVTIVLIEDNPSDVFLMNLAIEETGLEFRMIGFPTGADALNSLCPATAGTKPLAVPDLILLDLNTPRTDGFEVLTRIRRDARLSHVPVAIVTSSSSPADRSRAEQLGATTYLQKATELVAFLGNIGSAVKELLGAARAG